jgi:hypothetical protein
MELAAAAEVSAAPDAVALAVGEDSVAEASVREPTVGRAATHKLPPDNPGMLHRAALKPGMGNSEPAGKGTPRRGTRKRRTRAFRT